MTCENLFQLFAAEFLPPETIDATCSKLRELARVITVANGDIVRDEGDEGRVVFIALGAAKLVAHVSQEREQVVAFHFASDLVLVPGRAAHLYTLCALGRCDLLAFPADSLIELARSEPGLSHEILTRTQRALARSREKSIALGRKTAQERVASFLVSMAERIGSPQSGGYLLDLPMSRRDIADSLGLSIETISRQLGEFRDSGLLVTSGRSVIHLLDLPGLQDRSGHLPAAA